MVWLTVFGDSDRLQDMEGGRVVYSGPHTWWVAIECMLISLVVDGERKEITLWLTGIQYVNVLLMIVYIV